MCERGRHLPEHGQATCRLLIQAIQHSARLRLKERFDRQLRIAHAGEVRADGAGETIGARFHLVATVLEDVRDVGVHNFGTQQVVVEFAKVLVRIMVPSG